jgi:hypothetical protein
MRDRTRSRRYSPGREAFRREHQRHREWGLARRHAERLHQLRDRPRDSRPASAGAHPSRQPASARAWVSPSAGRPPNQDPLTSQDAAADPGRQLERAEPGRSGDRRAGAQRTAGQGRPGGARRRGPAPVRQSIAGGGRTPSARPGPGREVAGQRGVAPTVSGARGPVTIQPRNCPASQPVRVAYRDQCDGIAAHSHHSKRLFFKGWSGSLGRSPPSWSRAAPINEPFASCIAADSMWCGTRMAARSRVARRGQQRRSTRTFQAYGGRWRVCPEARMRPRVRSTASACATVRTQSLRYRTGDKGRYGTAAGAGSEWRCGWARCCCRRRLNGVRTLTRAPW